MGFITNQWLKGDPERSRKHSPIKISFELGSIYDAWCRRKEVNGAILAMREDGDYQSLYFTELELNQLMPTLARGADINTRQEIAFDTLLCLSDTDLLNFFADVLSRRASDKNTAD